jgi:hypothetical protein
MIRILIYICITLVLFACKPKNTSATSEYISVPAFITQQDAAIKSLKGHYLKKTVVIDGIAETKNVLCDTFSLQKELMLFNDIDINKAAYRGVFKVDTIIQHQGYEVVYNNAGENHLPLKKLAAVFGADNKPLSLSIDTKRTNLISCTDEHLKITNNALEISYSASIHEELKTGNKSTTSVQAVVVK